MKKELFKIDSKFIMRDAVTALGNRTFDLYHESGSYEHHHKIHSWIPEYIFIKKEEDGYHEYLTGLLIVTEEEKLLPVSEGIYFHPETILIPSSNEEVTRWKHSHEQHIYYGIVNKIFKFHDGALTAKVVKVRMDKKEAQKKAEIEEYRAKIFRR